MPRSASRTVVLLAAALLILLGAGWLRSARTGQSAAETSARSALLQTLGLGSLAISADCTASRSLIEGICGCLSDVPGGYCYHTSCDIIGAPKAEESDLYALQIED